MYCATHWALLILNGPIEEAPPPAPPVVFDVQLAAWLVATLGVACYPLKVPEEVTDYPVLTYTLVDGDSETGLSGPTGQAWRNYQFDAYSTDFAEAATLDEQLRLVIEGYRGPIGLSRVTVSQRHRPLSDYESSPDGSDDGVFRFMGEYTLWFVQPVASR